ncbi:MAG: GNAT family N-acetyltransferase [Haloferacaceae archaeon]
MSVNVETGVDAPGETEYVDEAWELKERIREEAGVLKQREGFFRNAYRRARSHLLFVDDDLAAFASVRTDGYILFLAVAPEHHGEGFGRRLIAEIADDHRTVTCHARTTNDEALHFYEHVGFEIKRRVDSYYEDGGDAYYLRLGEEGSIRDRLSELLGR